MSTFDREEARLRWVAQQLNVDYPSASNGQLLPRPANVRISASTRADRKGAAALDTPKRGEGSSGSSEAPTPDVGMAKTTEHQHDDSSITIDSSSTEGGAGSPSALSAERGLQRALIVARAENRALLREIQHLKNRELEMVSLGARAHEQFKSAQHQLESLKATFRADIRRALDENELHRLASSPADSLDIVDTIRYAVHQHLGKLQKERDDAVNELHSYGDRLLQSEAVSTRLTRENQDLQLQAKHDVASLTSQVAVYEERVANLERSLHSVSLNTERNIGKAARFDEIEAGLKNAELEKARLTKENGELERKSTVLAGDLHATKDELLRDRSLLQSTQTEVKFVVRERDQLQQRVVNLEENLHRLTAAKDDAAESKVSSVVTLGQEREELRTSYQRQLEAELERLRKSHGEELDRVRGVARDVSQRESVVLREARDAALLEVHRARQELEEEKQNHKLTQQTAQSGHEQMQSQLFELRMAVATKTNEALRLDLSYRETLAIADDSEEQCKLLQKKLEVLKEEFYDMKAGFKERVVELEGRLKVQDEQLGRIGDIEKEAEVFLGTLAASCGPGSQQEGNPGGTAGSTTANLLHLQSPTERVATQLLGDVPTSRRVAHIVTVTKRALALENKVQLLQHDASVREQRVTKLERDLDMARHALQNVHAPYALVEASLRKAEQELEKLTAENGILRAENDSLLDANRQLVQDVQRLTSHRDEISRIRAALVSYQQHQQRGDDDDGEGVVVLSNAGAGRRGGNDPHGGGMTSGLAAAPMDSSESSATRILQSAVTFASIAPPPAATLSSPSATSVVDPTIHGSSPRRVPHPTTQSFGAIEIS